MSHTIVEIFVKVVPRNLFRSGTKNSPRLDKLRTMPPRVVGEAFDIKIHQREGTAYVESDSGGISTFERSIPTAGDYWWVIPKGTKIPLGLRVTQDRNPNPYRPTHYTIRPAHDMPLSQYITLLQELALSAERTFEVKSTKSGTN